MTSEIENKATEYVTLSRQMADIKQRMDKLKGWFETQGLTDMDATKIKVVDYWCDDGKVEVGRSETVSPVALVLLKQIFGAAYDELVKPKTTLEMSADCKKLLAPMYLGNYIDRPIEEIIISAVPDDIKAQAALRKKLRGNFKSDRDAFKRLGGLAQKDAEFYAYLSTESVAYSKFLRLLKAGGWSGTVQEAVDIVKTAVVAEEGTKVTVDAAEK